jgi:hypothetical protein
MGMDNIFKKNFFLVLILLISSVSVSYAGDTIMDCDPEPTDMNIAYGEFMTGGNCAIGNGGDVDLFRFNGTAGDYVVLSLGDGIDNTAQNPCFEVRDSANQIVVPNTCTSNASKQVKEFLLPSSGSYLILVKEDSNDAVVYGLSLDRLVPPTASSDPIPCYGCMIVSDISALGDLDPYLFYASAGDQVLITLTDGIDNTAQNPCMSLRNPDGTPTSNGATKCAPSFSATTIEQTIPETGDYTILVLEDTNDGVNFGLDVQCLVGPCVGTLPPQLTVPEAPTLNSAAPGNGNALLHFTANGDGGSVITGYTASCGAFSQAGISSPITVSGLTNSTQYSCSVIATNVVGDSLSSNVLSVTPISTTTVDNELRNISTRADVGTGDNIAIAGFIITGNEQKCVIVRGRGPSVGVPVGVTRLPDPMLTLKSGQTTIAANDNWTQQDNPDHVAIIEDSGKAPGDLLDAAIYTCLDPGPYTALLRGFLDTTGVGIAEVLDVDDSSSYLSNISTRARVGTDHLVTIAGFIITGNTPKQILVRGRGPSVGVPIGVTRLADPVLTLKSGQTTIGSNDNWQDAANAADISATGKAPGDPLDSAIMMELQPGAYTAILRGVGNVTGSGIVEVLDLTGRQ